MGAAVNVSAPPVMRLAHPLAFAAFLRHVGAPVDLHLHRQGLPVFCNDPDQLVPLRRAWAFFDAAAQSEDALLGWHVGRFIGDLNLNLGLLRKLENAPSLYEALKRLVRLVSVEASHLQLGIRERGVFAQLIERRRGHRRGRIVGEVDQASAFEFLYDG